MKKLQQTAEIYCIFRSNQDVCSSRKGAQSQSKLTHMYVHSYTHRHRHRTCIGSLKTSDSSQVVIIWQNKTVFHNGWIKLLSQIRIKGAREEEN